MKPNTILTNNDWFLNDLFSFLPQLDITKVSANYSRYVIDVNREMSKKHVAGDYTQTLIYNKTTFGKDIYEKELSEVIINDRIEQFYKPYHLSLLNEINNGLSLKKKVYLFDLHSFYAQSTADIVLGTCGRVSCSEEFLNIVYNSFIKENFTVKIDEKGLRGGYIVSNYGSIENVEAIQIEIRYTAYIEERYFGEEEVKCKDNKLFNNTQKRLYRALRDIIRKLNVSK